MSNLVFLHLSIEFYIERWTNAGLKKPMVDLNIVKKRILRRSVRKIFCRKLDYKVGFLQYEKYL